jgi:hypothetical protein
MSETTARERTDQREIERRSAERTRKEQERANTQLENELCPELEPQPLPEPSSQANRHETVLATMTELRWRHAHWWDKRERILSYLRLGWIGRTTTERFANCGAMATVEWSDVLAKHRVRAILCKSRHCEPCMRQKAGRIAGNLKEKMRTCPPGSFRFITLTLRHDTDTPLKAQLVKLIKNFRALRARPIWKKTQVGGAFTIEVKRTKNGWHAHLHVISQGKWCDRDQLRNAWESVTGDSFNADIRRIADADVLAGYVVKYVTKSTSDEVWQSEATAKEYILAIKGVRTCATLGTWRGLKLTEPKPQTDDWKEVGVLHDLLTEGTREQPWAQAIILSLRPPEANTEHKPRTARRKPNHPTPRGQKPTIAPRH